MELWVKNEELWVKHEDKIDCVNQHKKIWQWITSAAKMERSTTRLGSSWSLDLVMWSPGVQITWLGKPRAQWNILWLVIEPTPLKNDGVKVSWDDDIPNWMESHKSHVPNHQPVMAGFLSRLNVAQYPKPTGLHRRIHCFGASSFVLFSQVKPCSLTGGQIVEIPRHLLWSLQLNAPLDSMTMKLWNGAWQSNSTSSHNMTRKHKN
jgi:hypothetical protein